MVIGSKLKAVSINILCELVLFLLRLILQTARCCLRRGLCSPGGERSEAGESCQAIPTSGTLVGTAPTCLGCSGKAGVAVGFTPEAAPVSPTPLRCPGEVVPWTAIGPVFSVRALVACLELGDEPKLFCLAFCRKVWAVI